MDGPSPTQYATDANLRARQRLWDVSRNDPPFDLFRWVRDLAGLDGYERIVDVGCGNGGLLALVNAVGLDLSFGMLAAARERTTSPLVCGNVEALPFRDGSFDLVVAAFMLYHVQDRERAAREMARVLKPGGRCIAVTNGETNHLELVRLVEGAVGRGWRWRRPSEKAFSLENGADQLRAAFAQVERVDCPLRVFSVTDTRALAGYINSVADAYAHEVAAWTSWVRVTEECRRRAAKIVKEQGAFTVTSSVGAFVCRR